MKGGDGRPRSKDGEAPLQEEKNRGRRVGSRRREEKFYSPVVLLHTIMPPLFYNQ